ncbi:pimeloyl-ACP methyl ester carboxylesterase [Hamadaea flava]|nr:pimeloyl-ACP methyl ester carboxylesterase [Hamadaea flava]
MGGSHADWSDLAPILRPLVGGLAVDLPGFGGTPTDRRATGVAGNADALTRFLQNIVGEPSILIGTSMGALIAASTAAQAPDMVIGLALVSPPLPASAPWRTHTDVRRAAFAGAVPGIGEYLLRRRRAKLSARQRVMQMLQRSCADPTRINPTTLAALISAEEKMSLRPAADYLRAARSIALAVACKRAYWARMRTLAMPVLLVHGIHDQLVPIADARSAARRLPTWRYEELDCRHIAHLELPNKLAEILTVWTTAVTNPGSDLYRDHQAG